VDYYNAQAEGLGYQSAVEVHRALARIAEFPDAWPPLSDHTRRSRLRRFPDGLIYHVAQDTVLVIAVMHLPRQPDAWRARLPHLPSE